MTKQAYLKIDQIPLVCAMMDEIARQQPHVIPADAEMFNACISAANQVIEDIDGIAYMPIVEPLEVRA